MPTVSLRSTRSLTLRRLRITAVLTQPLLGLQLLQPSRTGGTAETNRVAVFRDV